VNWIESNKRVTVAAAAALATACSLISIMPSPASASTRGPRALSPTSEQAKLPPRGAIRDRVLPKRHRPIARAAATVDGSGRGGDYTVTVAGKPETVRVYMSTAFTALDTTTDREEIDRTNREWAEAFAKMPHGPELSKLTVYLSPYSEISSDPVCGSQADSCYDPNDGTIYLVGETPPDGAGILQIAMHEYGHHVAANRLNTPWDGSGWGPKYWASSQRVCSWVRRGKMWPFDQDTHYEDNPAEIWAETFRIISAKSEGLEPDPWEILNPKWDPATRPAILAAAQRDVTNPWRGRVRSTWSGRLGVGGDRTDTVRVPANLDGTIGTRLSTSGSLRASVRLVPRGGSLRDSKVCGASAVDAIVTRRSGQGRWALAARYPSD